MIYIERFINKWGPCLTEEEKQALIIELEELSGRKILKNEKIVSPVNNSGEGVDIYISTSSN